jgi:hypothetical protein
MSKRQFWILNLVGGLCALVLLGNLVLALLNKRLNQSVLATQARFNQAQQLQTTAENLLVRIAQSGQNEPSLKALLVRHDFQVNLSEARQTSPKP